MSITPCVGSGQEPSIYLPRQREGRCLVCRRTVKVVNGKVAEHDATDPFAPISQRNYGRYIFAQWSDRDDSV